MTVNPMMVTYAEQQLILSEARIRGWITTGTAQNYYESGVKSALAAVMATKRVMLMAWLLHRHTLIVTLQERRHLKPQPMSN